MVIFVGDNSQENCEAKCGEPERKVMYVEEQPFEHVVGQREAFVLKPSANRKSEGMPISL